MSQEGGPSEAHGAQEELEEVKRAHPWIYDRH